jgi:5-(aminomethyl)-3-furanmethanol phosphate kinase
VVSKLQGQSLRMMSNDGSLDRYGSGEIVVAKIGGSLLKSGEAASALKVIAKARMPIVIVAGGGAFADQVRATQRTLGLSDKAAHRMAILAMHQNALALCDLAPGLEPVETIAEIHLALRRGQNPVWLPLKMCDRDRELPQDWSITSDGVAARLAERLDQAEVILLKSCDVPAEAEAEALAIAGIVDTAFVEITNRAGLDWQVYGPAQHQAFAARLLDGRKSSVPVGKPHHHSVHARAPVRLRRAIGRR